MRDDEMRWSRWARKVCTFLIWVFGLSAVFLLALLLFTLVADGASVTRFWAQNGRISLEHRPLDLSLVVGVANLRWLVLVFFLGVLLLEAGVILVLVRLRNLLDEVALHRPFSSGTARDLRHIGNLLLLGSVAIPLLEGALQGFASAMVPGFEASWNLLPELTLLFCGLLVKTLAAIFVRGARLQVDADLTV